VHCSSTYISYSKPPGYRHLRPAHSLVGLQAFVPHWANAKCQWWLYGGLICAVCYPCTICALCIHNRSWSGVSLSLMWKEWTGKHICCVECCVIAASVLWNIVCIAWLQVCYLMLFFGIHLSLSMKSFHVCVCVCVCVCMCAGGIICSGHFFLWVYFKHAQCTVDTHIITRAVFFFNLRSCF